MNDGQVSAGPSEDAVPSPRLGPVAEGADQTTRESAVRPEEWQAGGRPSAAIRKALDGITGKLAKESQSRLIVSPETFSTLVEQGKIDSDGNVTEKGRAVLWDIHRVEVCT